jgi:DNA/RNA-binding domain of Phe-tRNA-synthetase-like protein
MDPVELSRAEDCLDVVAGLVEVRGSVVGPSPPELEERIAQVVERTKALGEADIESVRGAVRAMLRHGRYKPTGRAKPASEYLVTAAREDRFPFVNNLVDINNLISLEFLLPISIIDLGRVEFRGQSADESRAPWRFALRRGRQGESYVFNAAGQSIDLWDLLLVAHLPSDAPCANPVKDSMATKVSPITRDALAIVYAPRSLEAGLAAALTAMGDALRRWSGSGEVTTRMVAG